MYALVQTEVTDEGKKTGGTRQAFREDRLVARRWGSNESASDEELSAACEVEAWAGATAATESNGSTKTKAGTRKRVTTVELGWIAVEAGLAFFCALAQ